MSYKSESEGRKRIRTGVAKTPEEIAARRVAAIERSRKYREQKKATETPEQAAERCAKRAEHLRKMRAIRTAEQRAKRTKQLMKTLAIVTLEKFAEETEQLEQSILTETVVQKGDLLLQEKNFPIIYQHLECKEKQQAMETSREVTKSKERNGQRTLTQNLRNSSETQDGESNSWRQSKQDESTDAESSNKFEEPDSKRRAIIKNTLKCVSILLDASKKRDEHSIYGEYIAQKIRSCNRESYEINIAQHHIENIIFKLSMGAYKIEKQNLPALSCFQPLVFPKIESDP